jgi:uncharacterized membrane protein YtjA (UPF0391 family)
MRVSRARAAPDQRHGHADSPDIRGDRVMLQWALIFLVIALVAGALGFFVLATTAAAIAKVLFFVFLVLFLVSLIRGRGRPVVP